ncbi:Uncharacterised protein [Nocardia otitidiscaviarum]|uniref:Uncharacterized protein n=1 Tax=Nocardia otitidiscaviarum TaxID=1823 RepID=A0A378YVA0_9NOCA|nr:Uncharacterised protein [Nocardia otitidiscaviarum]
MCHSPPVPYRVPQRHARQRRSRLPRCPARPHRARAPDSHRPHSRPVPQWMPPPRQPKPLRHRRIPRREYTDVPTARPPLPIGSHSVVRPCRAHAPRRELRNSLPHRPSRVPRADGAVRRHRCGCHARRSRGSWCWRRSQRWQCPQRRCVRSRRGRAPYRVRPLRVGSGRRRAPRCPVWLRMRVPLPRRFPTTGAYRIRRPQRVRRRPTGSVGSAFHAGMGRRLRRGRRRRGSTPLARSSRADATVPPRRCPRHSVPSDRRRCVCAPFRCCRRACGRWPGSPGHGRWRDPPCWANSVRPHRIQAHRAALAPYCRKRSALAGKPEPPRPVAPRCRRRLPPRHHGCARPPRRPRRARARAHPGADPPMRACPYPPPRGGPLIPLPRGHVHRPRRVARARPPRPSRPERRRWCAPVCPGAPARGRCRPYSGCAPAWPVGSHHRLLSHRRLRARVGPRAAGRIPRRPCRTRPSRATDTGPGPAARTCGRNASATGRAERAPDVIRDVSRMSRRTPRTNHSAAVPDSPPAARGPPYLPGPRRQTPQHGPVVQRSRRHAPQHGHAAGVPQHRHALRVRTRRSQAPHVPNRRCPTRRARPSRHHLPQIRLSRHRAPRVRTPHHAPHVRTPQHHGPNARTSGRSAARGASRGHAFPPRPSQRRAHPYRRALRAKGPSRLVGSAPVGRRHGPSFRASRGQRLAGHVPLRADLASHRAERTPHRAQPTARQAQPTPPHAQPTS